MQALQQKIVVLGTGGTIAGVSHAGAQGVMGYTAAQLGVGALLEAAPGLASLGCTLVSEQVAQVDSKDMDLAVWQLLLSRCLHWLAQDDVAGLVVTHGTDTLEETAYFLHRALSPDKPVVLTCAMRPADAPDADGPGNLRDAVQVASAPEAHGVLAVCAGQIHAAARVQKIHPTQINPFSSGDAGVLGEVVQGQIRWCRTVPDRLPPLSAQALQRVLENKVWPRVEIVTSHAASDGALVDAMLWASAQPASGVSPVQGWVVAATGNGSVHQRLEAALRKAVAQGARVLRSTRCCMGSVSKAQASALNDTTDLPPSKARVALMMALLLAQP